jgi:hypothetical protein
VTEFGWPVEGNGAANDGSHFLVDQDTQQDLLNASFEMMKGNSGLSPKRNLKLQNILYYNLEDWVSGEGEGFRNWDSHCGLVEDNGRGEKGNFRKAWFAFKKQAE